ncbi:MAG: NUDIX hydrolase N-terminal domain-containing protein, partial [Anaerolineae bacterium]|nr:NUDIX hydrolase N-terminal domain-containing protein [Anaerolineae bacterium]
MSIPQWLDWAQRLQSIAQTGLHYDAHPFDRLRYEDVMQIAAEMLAAGSGAAVDEIKPLLLLDRGHTTPKIDVRGVVFQDGKILLVQEKLDNYRWTLPGG